MENNMLDSRPSEDCGCPEEDWVLSGLFVTIHLEEDGSGHIMMIGECSETEKLVACNGIEDLRHQAAEWAKELVV